MLFEDEEVEMKDCVFGLKCDWIVEVIEDWYVVKIVGIEVD